VRAEGINTSRKRVKTQSETPTDRMDGGGVQRKCREKHTRHSGDVGKNDSGKKSAQNERPPLENSKKGYSQVRGGVGDVTTVPEKKPSVRVEGTAENKGSRGGENGL